jgi:hypothetical protein
MTFLQVPFQAIAPPPIHTPHGLLHGQCRIIHCTLSYALKAAPKQLFNYRKQQAWPPSVQKGIDWESLYQVAFATIRDAESIAATVDEAISWVNDFISEIAKA